MIAAAAHNAKLACDWALKHMTISTRLQPDT